MIDVARIVAVHWVVDEVPAESGLRDDRRSRLAEVAEQWLVRVGDDHVQRQSIGVVLLERGEEPVSVLRITCIGLQQDSETVHIVALMGELSSRRLRGRGAGR